MRNILILTISLICMTMSSCKKDNETGLSSTWAGIYNTQKPAPASTTTASIDNIIVSQVSANTLKIQLKAVQSGYVYTYTILQNVTINGTGTASIDEMEGITGNTGKYHITGTVALNSTHITLTATTISLSSTSELNTTAIYFSGERKQ